MYESLPHDLTSLPNWVGWKLEIRDNKPTKVPYSQVGVMASTSDPKSWRTFDQVKGIVPSKEKGIGFVFDGNGIVGIDLDHCLTDNKISDIFKHIPETLNSYTEISPSGTGLHIFIRCETPPYELGKHKNNVEIYSSGRYFTVTGNVWLDKPIATVPVETVRALLDEFVDPPRPVSSLQSTPSNLSDEDIIRIASNSHNSQKFLGLMEGKSCGDKSSDDMALASMLSFYTSDSNQIERIMRSSGLVREKWDKHQKYLKEYTIAKAISTQTSHFESKYERGDAEEGKVSAEAIINKKKPAPKQNGDITESEYKKIMKAARQENKLPPFPQLPNGIFKDYVDFGERISYSTKEFHFAALLPILSMVLGRRVVTNIGMMRLYPNIFSMVIGPTTISGKSYACNMAVDQLAYIIERKEELSGAYGSTQVKSKTISEAALIQGLSDVYNLFWHYDDCRPFFEEATTWNSHILGTLCSIYDGSKVERTLSKRGKNGEAHSWVCPEPFVSLLFNTTNDDFEQSANSGLFSSGFIPRMMMFIGDGGKMRENEDVPEEEKAILESIKLYIKDIREEIYPLENDSLRFGVCKIIEKWKIDATNKHLATEEDAYRVAIARGFIHAYKLAVLMTVFDKEFRVKYIGLPREEYPIKCAIPDKYALMAIKLVEEYLLPRTIYIHDLCEEIDKKNHQSLITKCLKKIGGVADKTKLLRMTHLGKKDMDAALSTLIESEEIEMYTVNDACKPKIIVTLLKSY